MNPIGLSDQSVIGGLSGERSVLSLSAVKEIGFKLLFLVFPENQLLSTTVLL